MPTRIEAEGLDDAVELLEEMAARMASPEPALLVIGSDVVEIIDSAFARSRAPSGVPWEPLKGPRRHGRDVGTPKPLIDTGRLRRSVTYSVVGQTLSVGTNVEYAGAHQFGTTRIPARPYMPADRSGNWTGSRADLEEFGRMLVRFIETGRVA